MIDETGYSGPTSMWYKGDISYTSDCKLCVSAYSYDEDTRGVYLILLYEGKIDRTMCIYTHK